MTQIFDQFSALDPARERKQVEENIVVGTDVNRIVALTQAAYDALPSPDTHTLYVIVG